MAEKKSKNNIEKYAHLFDENFEITYDEDFSELLQISPAQKINPYQKMTKPIRSRKTVPHPTEAAQRDLRQKSSCPEKLQQDSAPRKKHWKWKGNIASSLIKGFRTGGQAAASILQKLLRATTLILTLTVMAVIAVNFWNGHSAYGNIKHIAAEKNYALAAFLGVGVCLLLFELFAFFRSMGSQKVRKGNRNYRQDVGRGMFPFIFVCAGSFVAGIFARLIPESPAALSGLKSGIVLYGSLNSTLLVLCTAGVISCILRRLTAR